MSQIRMTKYTYNKCDSFEVRDSSGQPVWIVIEQMVEPYEGATHKEWQPIPIEFGY